MNWVGFIGSVVGAFAAGGLLAGLLNRWLMSQRFRHQQPRDTWERIQQSYERQIELLEKAGDTQAANQLRMEYVAQQAAWRAQQRVTALAPREVTPEGGASLTSEEAAELRRLLAASANLDRGALSAQDHFQRGNSYARMGQHQDALAEYNRALELRPDHPTTLYNRGIALGNLGRYQEALADLSSALTLRPDHPDTLYNRGLALVYLKRDEEALTDYNCALELQPDHHNTLYNRGNLSRALGRHKEALRDYDRALELRPDDSATLNSRGNTLADLERYNEALADYNRALQLEPNRTITLNNRGNALANLERYDEALADYNRALALWPDYPDALYNVACLFSMTGRYQEALDWLRRAIGRDAKYRSMTAEDSDFAPLRDHPQFGPQFRQLVAGDGGEEVTP